MGITFFDMGFFQVLVGMVSFSKIWYRKMECFFIRIIAGILLSFRKLFTGYPQVIHILSTGYAQLTKEAKEEKG